MPSSAKPTRVPLARLAGLARRGLGLDRLSERLDAIEAHLVGQRWPHGPVYLGDHTALVATRWGAKMLVETQDSLLAPWLLLDGLWEANVTGWLESTLQPGQVFVDVGANIGYFTLLAGRLVGPTGRVVAIEAHPRLAELLRRNVIINGMHGYVTAHHGAAWSESTSLKFHLRVHYAANSSAASVGAEGLANLDDAEEVIDVDAVALDDLLADLPKVDVMKVDVEGAELHVFNGLHRILEANPAITIVFEWSPAQLLGLGDEPAALLDVLSGHGFGYRLIEDDLAPIDRPRLLDLPYGNVVATRWEMAATSSVVVVSYRPGTWLIECLQSVMPQADEVILVDNGSPDGEAAAIGRDVGATVIEAGKNLGFGGGVNLGVSRARGDVVGLLNDDATAGPGWLKVAADVLSDRAVAAVTPKVLLAGGFAEIVLGDEEWSAPGDARPLGRLLRSVRMGDTELLDSLIGGGVHDLERGAVDGLPSTWRWTSGPRPFYLPMDGCSPADQVTVNGEAVTMRGPITLLNHAGCCLTRDGKAADYGFAAPDDGRFDQATERFALSGTAAVFRAETLATLGGLSSEFFAYYEDIDWCLRARLHGLRILYDPRASVSHRLSATSGGPKDAFVRFLAHRNWLLFLARGAPADVARTYLWRGVADGPAEGVRRAVLQKLPWALASRARMHRLWVTTPRAVWDRWAGVDTTWDDSPARS